MSDVPQVLLTHHLKALRLPTFLRDHEKLLGNAPRRGLIISVTCCAWPNASCLIAKGEWWSGASARRGSQRSKSGQLRL